VIAVVAGYAARVDVEADAAVGGDPVREVRDADGDVIDAGKNGCVFRVGAEDSTSRGVRERDDEGARIFR